ncbi:M66 family metalloprotease [Aquimarina rubra]|uniref:M66 family metalloprotease n=1 Tax=Aquimarina rubra TaxID=1920033 RepID=A0ABW5LMX7_9FLAO
MKNSIFFVLFSALIGTSCSNDDDQSNTTNPYQSDKDFEVFFAQTHVLHPNDPTFILIGEKETLLKAQITSSSEEDSPNVNAVLTLGSNSITIPLNGPATLPAQIDLRPGIVEHKYDDSFTGIIPKDWMKPGLKIAIEAGEKTVSYNDLKIGAPNKIIMTMFDINYFQASPGDYPVGWKEELEAKWPVSEINLRRVPNIIFEELTIPPRGNLVAARASSKEDYQNITGGNFDGEQAAASQWNGALKAAAGTRGRISLFYVNIYGVSAGGQAGGFGGVGNGKSIGILNHELGHAFSLPHWGDNQNYPYKGDLFGIPSPDSYNKTHAGPVWAFDIPTKNFIPPTVQPNSVGGTPGVYKKDPMQGGGTGNQEEGFLMNHFSDYSVNQMKNYLEGHIVIWNETLGEYASWDTTTDDYSNIQNNNGVQFPLERDVEVISVMAGVSSVTPQANIAYKPIGPYTSSLIEVFDPNIEADRIRAADTFCPNNGCDVSVRVTQGGETKVYMLAMDLDDSIDPLDAKSFQTRAVNLRASDGAVTKVEVLLTPDAEINGLPDSPLILNSWNN